jgi:hypothetical protein
MRICSLKRATKELFAVLLAASFVACASTPPPAKPIKRNEPPSIDLLCHPGAKAVRFDKLGISPAERPVDVAISRDSIWVLFSGGRLLHLARRDADHLGVQMFFLLADQGWEKMDIDPLDESLWVVSQGSLDLYHVSPEGQVSTVKLQRKIEGKGGFAGLRVARDALYALPTCADSALWRLDRSGKVLGTAFKAPEKTPDAVQPDAPVGMKRLAPVCYTIRLERNLDGNLLAWDREKKEVWQVDADGNWTPSDSRVFTYLRDPGTALSVRGFDIPEPAEQWFFADFTGDLFFWKGQPIFMGSYTRETSLGTDTVINVPGENGSVEMLMPCNGFPVLDAASDAAGYAAITQSFLVLGDIASAPDLP